MKHPPKLPSFDALLAAIVAAPSIADVARLLETATTFFMGTQREELEATAAARKAELSDGGVVAP